MRFERDERELCITLRFEEGECVTDLAIHSLIRKAQAANMWNAIVVIPVSARYDELFYDWREEPARIQHEEELMAGAVQIVSSNMGAIACALYGGAELLEIDSTETTRFRILVEAENWRIFEHDYNNNRLAISDAKHLIERFSYLARKVKTARANGGKYQTDDYQWLLHGK